MKKLAAGVLAAFVLTSPARASSPGGFGLAVLVDGVERPEYVANGTIYVEALRGREYALRITNPLNVRVAVALAVDGLNTIDAKHTAAWGARKWVLAPYETIVLSGWQVNEATARKFYFTGERSSYGAFLGKTENLGVIEAVFYSEKQPYREAQISPWRNRRDASKDEERGTGRTGGTDSSKAGEPAGEGDGLGSVLDGRTSQAAPDSSGAKEKAAASPAPSSYLSEEYAATGIGTRTDHGVTAVSIDLEPRPVATVRLRYEFRPELVKLGVLSPRPDPLGRREAASGFGSWCPEPPGR
jgi:hypothetical protein